MKAAAGIAAVIGSAGLIGYGLFDRSRRAAKLTEFSLESNNELEDTVKLHPEAPGGELEIHQDLTASVEEASQKEVVLTK